MKDSFIIYKVYVILIYTGFDAAILLRLEDPNNLTTLEEDSYLGEFAIN